MKIAYCRDCKTVIAVGDFAPQRVVVRKGHREVFGTLPRHTVRGKEHTNVGLLDVPNQSIPFEGVDEWMKDLTRKHRNEFK